jgi:hypothetical protein
MWPEELRKLITFKYLIGSRTRDLPACSTLPQSVPYRVPLRCEISAVIPSRSQLCKTTVYAEWVEGNCGRYWDSYRPVTEHGPLWTGINVTRVTTATVLASRNMATSQCGSHAPVPATRCLMARKVLNESH